MNSIQNNTPRSQIAGLITGESLLMGLPAADLAALYQAWRSAHRDPAPQMRED